MREEELCGYVSETKRKLIFCALSVVKLLSTIAVSPPLGVTTKISR